VTGIQAMQIQAMQTDEMQTDEMQTDEMQIDEMQIGALEDGMNQSCRADNELRWHRFRPRLRPPSDIVSDDARGRK